MQSLQYHHQLHIKIVQWLDAHDEGGHRTNLVARYAFECERPEPFRLETTLFEQFERLEKIEATFLSDTVQGFHVLTPDETSAVYE